MTLMIIQLLIVLLALYVGSRYGSLALGAISGIGLAILVLGFVQNACCANTRTTLRFSLRSARSFSRFSWVPVTWSIH